MLAFMVGQVQYAYSSYFCTMRQMSVKSPNMSMNMPTDRNGSSCGECQVAVPPQHAQQLIGSNCIKVISAEKSVVSSFAERAKFHSQVVIAFSFIQADEYARQPGHQSLISVPPINSPPLDLPILNNNLRI